MIHHNYKILQIKGIDHSKYGNCLMVYANPITKLDYSFEFTTIIDKRTIKFLFPYRYLNEIQRIANTLEYWTPCERWYIKERIYDSMIAMHCPVYEHVNLDLERMGMLHDYDDKNIDLNDGDCQGKESLIPNLIYKWEKIIDDWEKEIVKPNTEWGYDKEGGPAEYVDIMCSEQEDFFSWLFDDDSILSISDLSEEQDEAYSDLINELDKEGCYP